MFSCTKFYPSFQAGAKVNWRKDFSKAPEQICGKARKRTQQKSWLPATFILLLLILPLQINWDIRILPLLYHWSALQPLEGAAKWVIQLAKIQMQDEWFARGCKMSLRAGRWLEGRTSAGTFTSTAQMGLRATIRAATNYLHSSKRKGTKSRKSSDCNTQHSPKGVQKRVAWAIRGTEGPTSDRWFKKPSISAWPGND